MSPNYLDPRAIHVSENPFGESMGPEFDIESISDDDFPEIDMDIFDAF